MGEHNKPNSESKSPSSKLDKFLSCYKCASYEETYNKCEDFNTSSSESYAVLESMIVHTILEIKGTYRWAEYHCITYDTEDIYTVVEDKGVICSGGCKIPIVCSAGNAFSLGEDLRIMISKHETMQDFCAIKTTAMIREETTSQEVTTQVVTSHMTTEQTWLVTSSTEGNNALTGK